MPSSSSLEREIDDYQDGSSESDGSVDSSSCSDSSDEHYSSGVPGIPLEEFQEQRHRAASGSGASSSRQPSSPPQDEEEDEDVIYSCAPEVASTLDGAKLKTLVDRYQIPKELNPRLPQPGEWCCSPSSGLGVYASYLLAGLRFPLNSFCRDLFQRLGIGPNQLNPNGWRTIVAMQILWREALEGNRPITVDEFLYCYKPSEIKKSAGFYQFSSRGSYYSLITGRSSSDRLWKKEFFIISGNWAGDPADVGIPLFPPFTSPLGRLRPEAVVRPRLDKFFLDQIEVVRTFPGRTFHDLVTFSRLATWGLGPTPTAENLSHEELTRRRISTMRENKEKTVASGDEDVAAPTAKVASVQAGKRKSKSISSTVDLDDLPSRRGHKKQKPRTSLPKVPKFVPPTVNLDEPVVDVEPVQTVHPVPSDPPPAPKTSHKSGSSESSDRPSNLVLDEGYAWRTFKGIVTDHEVNECYNMSVKEFERSGIHDLFKAMSKFYTATCQAKELATEAKTAKDKAKELGHEVLLKKGEVIRLTEDFNRLLGSETKLKNEVEELKADNLEKDTRIVHLEGQVSELTSSLEKAREEAIAAFKKSDEYKNRLDSHYAAGYEDFRADAKRQSSALQTSSEDVNIMDDANTEVIQDDPKTSLPK
ncbi:uncharacterized protein LOC115989999 [Quercus lobata]|uniref:uncharacterized protein LOC115989999 n=1 Tax=Quercus lobata TaxID=97700 RepID=UPI00124855F9|nr:uncharacterized protein LOC115989999 [Quercus lobata]